jgi:putative pyrroloquinoline-quinone binding quinoprotein/putative pyrroloquinoline-quinone-binding quinoprotein
MRSSPLFLSRAVALALFCTATAATAADWMQFGYDAAHTGYNPAETTVNASNVSTLTTLYSATIAAGVDSAPVYLSNVVTPGGTKNLLFALSKNGRLMALDAADGSEVWHATSSGTQPTTASPAIDAARQYVYSYGIDGYLHKYQVGDGTEITGGGWPELITRKIDVEKGASGLTIVNAGGTNWLYSVTDGYIGDGGDYQGHITTINLDTGEQVVFNTLCSNLEGHLDYGDCTTRQSGIWGRGGATYDAGTDRVFIATGNGNFNANSANGFNWGDSTLALAHDGTGSGGGLPRDSYTPSNYQQLDDQDIDLGSISLVIMQPPAGSAIAHLGMQTGKDAKLRLINLDNMSGQGGPRHTGGEIQLLNVPQGGGGMREQPATWVDGSGTAWLFVANSSGLSGLTLGLDGSMPKLSSVWQKSNATTSPVVANGVLYSFSNCSGGTCIVARNPATGDALWTSAHVSSPHWQSPIVVDGVVYAIDNSSKLWAFGLGTPPVTHTVTPSAGPNGSIAPSTPQTVNDGSTIVFTLTPDPHYRVADATGCGGSLSGNTYTTGPITADCAVSATFEAAPTHVVTPDAGDGSEGTIDPSTPQTVDDGDTTAFTVTPAAHYGIASVTGCGGSLDGATYTTGAITADCTVSATFSIITHTVTPNAGTNGSIAPATPQTVDDGATTSFTLTPTPPYLIDTVTGCGGSLDGTTYTTGAITADCTINATFALDQTDPIYSNGFDSTP